MFGKLGRAGGAGGRGGGNGKRHLPPPTHRTMAPSSRVGVNSTAVQRRGGAQGPGSGESRQVSEETFSMVSGGPLDFASIIRLTPDLVVEIKRAEERGGAVRIKFDSNRNDSSANVIDIDGKEFRFTWSIELGDLCDIYEERRNGESGNGLLAECGSAWRKLNVQRILDESIKNHVKMRSKEAEQKLKSRRAIVLDLANPSVKKQSSAAVEGSMRIMHWEQKKDPLHKKQKADNTQAPKVVPSKMVLKSKASPRIPARGGQSVSPIPSPAEKTGFQASPNLVKGLTNVDVVAPVASNKEDAGNFEKDVEDNNSQPSKKIFNHKGIASQPTDLRSMLVSLLLENPKGITLKALEKAVRDTMPNSTMKIESVLRNVANFQTPGRYFLKSGVGIESCNMPLPESGSSPENAQEGTIVGTYSSAIDRINESDPQHFSSKVENVSDIIGKTDKQSTGHDLSATDRNVNNEHGGQAGTTSGSGSDSESESESSYSGSDSGSQSRSKSKSPVVSESGSSSDSDSDVSSSSKETDVHVDITTSDDEKEDAGSKSLAEELKSSSFTGAWETHDKRNEDKRDEQVPSPDLNSDNIEINDDIPHSIDNNKRSFVEDNVLTSKYPSSESLEGMKTEVDQVFGVESLVDVGEEKPPLKDVPNSRSPGIAERSSKSKSKRPFKMKIHQEKSSSAKKPKDLSSGKKVTDFSEEANYVPPEKPEENQHKDITMKFTRPDKLQDFGGVSNSHIESEDVVPVKCTVYGYLDKKQSTSDVQNTANIDGREPGTRHGDLNTMGNSFVMEKPDRSDGKIGRGTKHGERVYTHHELDNPVMNSVSSIDRSSMLKNKRNKDTQNADIYADEKHISKSVRGNVFGERPFLPDHVHSKSGEYNKSQKNNEQLMPLQGVVVGKLSGADVKGSNLERSFSELEAGEFREPSPLEKEGLLEQKGSPMVLVKELNTVEHPDLSTMKGKISTKGNAVSRKQSPFFGEARSYKAQEGSQKKVVENFTESMRFQQHTQQLTRVERVGSETLSHFDKRSSHSNEAENHTNTYKKNPPSYPDGKLVSEIGNKFVSESKDQKIIEPKDSDKKKDDIRRNGDYDSGKKRKSSHGEDLYFTKFEKDEPQLKGPINDYAQYSEYVQEYEEKYDCYHELNDQIEKIRDEFLRIGGDLPELSKGRDIEAYNDCCRRVMKFDHQYKRRLDRLKKTFIVLHEELTTLKHRIKIFVEEYTKE